MNRTSLLVAGLAAGLLSYGAYAQSAPGGGMGGMSGMGPGMGGRSAPAADCSKAKNPAQCEARHKAREICKDMKGTDHASCMEDNMPGPDCKKAKNPPRCESRQKAHEACKGMYGEERRKCSRDLKKPASSPKKS